MPRPAEAVLLAAALALGLAGCDLDPGRADAIVQAPDARTLVVETASGPVAGRVADAGAAFLGIPYAAPPVGPLRWQAPQPPAPWMAPRPATRLGPTCLQNLSLAAQTGERGTGPLLGDEDCLTLNVYAPPDLRGRRPVMVFVHGGAFVLGSSGQYDPSRLARAADAVVVTFNYRLGALGFLAHPGLRDAPGEGAYALLDQQAALRWVKRNIAGFGGDPKSVTLFGQTAGAWSACAQMAAPGAAGLFQRVILQSGACTTPQTSLPAEAAEAGGLRMAAALGCEGADALACLRGRSAEEIVTALPERDGVTGPNAWAPATGRDVLPLPPREAFERGRFNKVPVIDGTNRDEGRLFTYLRGFRADLWTAGSYAAIIEAFFGKAAPAILAAYPADRFPSAGDAYAAVLTDALFACPAEALDRTLARFVPVYAYEFADPEAPSNLPPVPWGGLTGAFHTAELASVFGTPWALADPADFSPAQARLSAVIQGYWGGFAHTGDPNRAGLPGWNRFGPDGTILSLLPAAQSPTPDFAARHNCGFWSLPGG